MRRMIFVPFLALGIAGAIFACSDSKRDVTGDGGSPGSAGTPGTAGATPGTPGAGTPGTTVKELVDFMGDGATTGGTKISANRTLAANKDYLMKGVVYVPAGVTLTIEKGTTILGDKASLATLVVQPGGQLIANGTADEPIVFTSFAKDGQKAAGDWGGVILLGKARVNGGKAADGDASTDNTSFIEGLPASPENKYGGTSDGDSSGSLKYVRIEYSGVKIGADNEINGLTLGGVGSGTTIEHIFVRYTLDDCFEMFGGTVNAKWLVCAANQDDGLDMDNGYSGKVQFYVHQADPNVDDEMNGFEWDNDAQRSTNVPITNPTVYNATLCGQNKAGGAKRKFAMLLRRNTGGTIRNVLAWGFDAAVDVRDALTHTRAAVGSTATPTLTVQSSQFFKFSTLASVDGVEIPATTAPENTFPEAAWLKNAAHKNLIDVDPGAGFDCTNQEAPKFAPDAVQVDKAAAPPNDGFFDTTAKYIGAFKDANDKWAFEGKWAKWTKTGS